MNKKEIDPLILGFLTATHILGIAGFVHLYLATAFPWKTLALAIVWFSLSSFSITGGYHRKFSHRSYECSRGMMLFFILFGASAVQGAILQWAANHRRHHRNADTALDPHNIKDGFWWTHMGWVIFKHESYDPKSDKTLHGIDMSDLRSDPLIRFQYRWYSALAATFGFILPGCIALLWHDFWGGILFAGFSRILLQYHFTWSVNSFAHYFGKQPYAPDQTARDNWWVGLITLGEATQHNFHHKFERDYRNGLGWRFDPTKWVIWALQLPRLTRNLHRTPPHLILSTRNARQ